MLVFMPRTINIHIEFPALAALVQYLNTNQQKQIDDLTAQVTKLTQGLKQSADPLQESVDHNKEK